MSDFFDKGFCQNIAADFVFAAISFIFFRIKKTVVRWYPKTERFWNRAYLALLFVGLIGSDILYTAFALPHPRLFLLLSGVVTFVFVWRELNQFWGVGLVGGDLQVGKGLNYDKSLKLCRNGLDFLGVGAAKLTSSPEFEAAVQRCHRTNTPVRFLLVNPEHQVLRQAAERKGVATDDYRRKVKESLRVLAQLRDQKHFNIDVRFYVEDSEPLFRLMFINEQLCLMSYYVFGEGDGSQLPQMYVQRFQDRRDTDSFYHPLKVYFDKIWDRAVPWERGAPF